MPRLVCLADTHGRHGSLRGPLAVPDGDVLVFAGDACTRGTAEEWAQFCGWLALLPHAHKVVVAGNHDWPVQPSRPAWGVQARYGPASVAAARERVLAAGAVLVEDAEVVVAGLRVWGSPWVPSFNGWAFNLPRGGAALASVWGAMPPGLDVLVTHTPSFGRLDRTEDGRRVGCERLAERLAALDASSTGPRVHVHGDIHESGGVQGPPAGARGRLTVNAAVVDVAYRVVRAPVVVEV
ncbi:MAG: metallophosphatase domain-containing protein [Rubricoccaceae bacterium]|nr:metallophosphatase domain-containing protein [Rubricoccaceae bacterium]